MFLKNKDKVAIYYKEQQITYSALISNVFYYSSLYQIKKNDKVLIFSDNSLEWMYAFHSVWENKGVAVPVDCLSTEKELAYIINDCRPEVIFYNQERSEVLHKALKSLDYSPQLILLDEISSHQIPENNNELKESEMNETACIIYTSGTTGSPKGVMLSFENIAVNIDAVSKDVSIFDEKTRVLILLPLHHVFSLLGAFVAPLSVGGSVAVCPSMSSEDIMATLQNFQVTAIIGVPRLYASIRKGIKDKIKKSIVARTIFGLAKIAHSYAFSKFLFKSVHQKFGGHIDYMVCGGAPLDEAIARDFQILGFRVLEGYGMTETAPIITFTRPNDVKVGSAGAPLKGVEIRFNNKEIQVKGRNVMQGYYNRPEETAEVLKDGWLSTGDIGHMDSKGRLYVTGRSKEIIVLSNGKNINPVDLEFQLEPMLPLIKELAVFEKNDHLHLAVYPNFYEINKLGIEDLEAYLRETAINEFNSNVSSYKKLHQIYIASEELPKTRLGKIQRFKLQELEQIEKQQQEEVNNYDSEEYQLIKQHIEGEKETKVAPSHNFEVDLGLDSLDKVSLQVFIENTFGVKIGADHFENYPTVKQFSEYIKGIKTKMNTTKINWTAIVREKVNLKLPKSSWLHSLLVLLSKMITRTYFRTQVQGKENIPEGACIIAPNHQSFLDGLFLLSSWSKKEAKDYYFYAKAKHIKKKWMKKWADRNNIIVVDTDENTKFSIQALALALKQNKKIVIFPEGTRSKTGTVGEFKKMFAILSKELDVPVIPVAIEGAYEAMPRGSRFPRIGKKVKVSFLEAITPEPHDYDSLADSTKTKIETTIKQ